MTKTVLKSPEHVCSTCHLVASLSKIEGVIPILNAPQQCCFLLMWGTMTCRPSKLLTIGTLLKKREVIFGGEESLKQQILNAYNEFKPQIIVVLNTCVPQLIGEDVKGIAMEVETETPGCKIVHLNTGFNFPTATALANDLAWSAIVNVMEKQEIDKGTVGIISRTGTDAGICIGVISPLRIAGLKTIELPSTHLSEMMRIPQAEIIAPISVIPYLTCKKLSEKFNSKIVFSEVPGGIEGTAHYFEAVADNVDSKELRKVSEDGRKAILPKWNDLKEKFIQSNIRILIVGSMGSEYTISKILAGLGAEVTLVPSIRNIWAQQEMKLLREQYGVTIVDEYFPDLGDLIETYRPNAVFSDMAGGGEILGRFVHFFMNMNYLGEYGYEYGLEMGKSIYKTIKNPVFENWRKLFDKCGGKVRGITK